MSKLPLENKVVIAFAYLAIGFIILVLSSVVGGRKEKPKAGVSCCESKVCAEQHHHGN